MKALAQTQLMLVTGGRCILCGCQTKEDSIMLLMRESIQHSADTCYEKCCNNSNSPNIIASVCMKQGTGNFKTNFCASPTSSNLLSTLYS